MLRAAGAGVVWLVVLLACTAAVAAPARVGGAGVVVVPGPGADAWLRLLRASGFAAQAGALTGSRSAVLPVGAHVSPAAVARFVRGGGRVVTADPGLLRALGVRLARGTTIPGLDGGVVFAHPHRVSPLGGTTALVRSGPAVVAGTTHGGRVLALGLDPLAPGLQGHELLPMLGALAGRVLDAPPGPVREAAEVYLDPGTLPGLTPEELAAQLDGVRVAFVAGWDYAFLDRSFDYPYARLISALHAHGIQAYAWLEPPEVGLGPWTAHPECRERTRSGTDAVVDWRSLFALEDPSCFEIAWSVWSGLLRDYDWDGVNVAELYFETGGPNRETPYHPSALAAFGADPARDPAGFAAWRTREVTALNREVVTRIRALRPELGLELTVIDDGLDPALGRAVGSDVHALAQVARDAGATLQVEDPFTTWTRGPARYTVLGRTLLPLMPAGRALFDVNVVPRATGRPTAQMTGGELALSVADASATTGTVGLYAASTLTPADLVDASAALAASAVTRDAKVEAPRSVVLRSPKPALGTLRLDGSPWPAVHGRALVPPGSHRVQWQHGDDPAPALVRLTGELRSERPGGTALAFCYSATARAWATFDRAPRSVTVDGAKVPAAGAVVSLPGGDHVAVAVF